MAKLTPKQKKFADEYIKTGNATNSYMTAYGAKVKCAEANSSRLIRDAKVSEYIEQRNKQLDKTTIADMQEIKEFWTKICREEKDVDIKDRLKASEYIAKTNAAFIDRQELNANIAVKIVDDIE